MRNDAYYWWMVSLIVLAVVLACGCGSGRDTRGDTVDHGGELVSEEGQIAFMRAASFDGMDIESDIYIIRVDGSEERRLTDTPGLDGFPSWSPDGERIAFTSEDAKASAIYVMNSDGSGLTKLTDNPAEDSFPAWRP